MLCVWCMCGGYGVGGGGWGIRKKPPHVLYGSGFFFTKNGVYVPTAIGYIINMEEYE